MICTTRVEEAVEMFISGYTCSQSILATYCREFCLDRKTALKLATPFAGGMCRQGEACGAVTGSLMVIGLRFGTDRSGESIEKIVSREKGREFIERFKLLNRTVRCNELLGVDLGTPEGHREAKDRNLFKEECPDFVRDAAKILESVLDLS